jgi:UDP-N-acetylmuramoylalanine--D-glutamate ligase
MTYLGLDYVHCDDTDSPGSYDAYDIIIPSPGIPGTHAIYHTGKVVSELDFAYRYLPRGFQIVSITGTDGKSTTSWIMYNILEKEYSVNKSVYLSGNFDIPFSATALDILRS